MHEQTTKQLRHNDPRIALKVLLGGMLGLVVVMGIGRFCYTPILPLMQRDLGLSNSLAGWLAGLNYCGYLLGAVVCALRPGLLENRLITGGSLLVSLATTVFMGATVSVFWWGLMRLLGGVATAILFIVISAEVAGTLVRCGRSHWLGFLFAGVGLGIALSGLLVPVFDAVAGWQGSWYGMGGLAVALAAVGLWLGRQRNLVQPDRAGKAVARASLEKIYLLAAAYFFEGLGYIVTATFLVAMITVTPGLETLAPYSWVAVGCAAAPSTVAWPLLARRIGSRQALLLAYLVQGSGILVSIGADSVVAVLYAAVTFGGTFMGIVALTLAEGNRRMPAAGGLAAAFLTASFSVGQIFGPIIAGILADVRQGFDVPLLLATACIVLAGVAVGFDRGFQRS